jgi:hypothetical protein
MPASLPNAENTYKSVQYDAGRSLSRRPRQQRDCTVRAIATACDLEYDHAYDLLKQAGRKSHSGFPFLEFVLRNSQINGYRLKKVRVADLHVNPENRRFILRLQQGDSYHLIAFVAGHFFDSFMYIPDGVKICGVWEALPLFN